MGISGRKGRDAVMEQIIDIHTHIYPATLARRAMEVAGREHDAYEKLPLKENLLARMQENHIKLSVVQHVVTKPSTQTDVNRFASESLRKGLMAFGGLHPDCANVEEELERLKDRNMAGVKLHPPFQRVHLAEEKYREMWERINRLRFPVLIHCGKARKAGAYDFFPSDVRKILRYLPDVPVILAHMGGRSGDPQEEKILFAMPENVLVDTAMSAEFQSTEDFERLAQNMRPERVLFGSDFPYGSQKNAIEYIRKSCFSQEEKEMMLGKNAARILNIKTGSPEQDPVYENTK